MSLIEAKNIKKNYRDGKMEVHALRGIDLSIEQGEFTALAGPSGSGKSTLLNLIGALDTPTEGTVRLGDHRLDTLSKSELSRLRLTDIGFVFQAYNLIPVLSSLENVEFVMTLQNIPSAERTARAKEVLTHVGLGDVLHRRPGALSGGQQQRVAVARAIAARPKIILADEPTANLDSTTGGRLLDLMRELNQEEGITFLFSTHDPMVMDYARRLVKLKDGRIQSDETKN